MLDDMLSAHVCSGPCCPQRARLGQQTDLRKPQVVGGGVAEPTNNPGGDVEVVDGVVSLEEVYSGSVLSANVPVSAVGHAHVHVPPTFVASPGVEVGPRHAPRSASSARVTGAGTAAEQEPVNP